MQYIHVTGECIYRGYRARRIVKRKVHVCMAVQMRKGSCGRRIVAVILTMCGIHSISGGDRGASV